MKSDSFANINDEELFKRFRDHGSTDAFNLLYNRYNKKIFAYCLRSCPDRETAKDVFQKIFSSVVEKKESFKGGSFIAWLIIITRNYVLMEKRKEKNTEPVYENTLIDDELNEDDFVLRSKIRYEVDKLPEEYSEMVKLKYFDDFSYNEIAEFTGVSLALVKVRLFRAKKILTKNLLPLRESLK